MAVLCFQWGLALDGSKNSTQTNSSLSREVPDCVPKTEGHQDRKRAETKVSCASSEALHMAVAKMNITTTKTVVCAYVCVCLCVCMCVCSKTHQFLGWGFPERKIPKSRATKAGKGHRTLRLWHVSVGPGQFLKHWLASGTLPNYCTCEWKLAKGPGAFADFHLWALATPPLASQFHLGGVHKSLRNWPLAWHMAVTRTIYKMFKLEPKTVSRHSGKTFQKVSETKSRERTHSPFPFWTWRRDFNADKRPWCLLRML